MKKQSKIVSAQRCCSVLSGIAFKGRKVFKYDVLRPNDTLTKLFQNMKSKKKKHKINNNKHKKSRFERYGILKSSRRRNKK